MRRLYPLTAEEQDFAASQHFLVDRFLRFKRLPPAEYYDIAVFGFLEAVQKQFRAPISSERWNFEALAHICMEHAVGEDWKYQLRPMRRGDVLSLDNSQSDSEDNFSFHLVISDKKQDPVKQVENQDLIERVMSVATRREREVIELVCQGYAPYEVSRILGITPNTGCTILYHFRRKARGIRDEREIVKNPYRDSHREELRVKQAAYRARRKALAVSAADTQEDSYGCS